MKGPPVSAVPGPSPWHARLRDALGLGAGRRDGIALALEGLVLYGLLSMACLPFLGALWLGELPVLVVPQLPKLLLAGWIRTGLVMPLLPALGLSRGSFSPDYALAGPSALAIAYALPIVAVLVAIRLLRRPLRPYLGRLGLVLAVAVADYLLTLAFAARPGLTVY